LNCSNFKLTKGADPWIENLQHSTPIDLAISRDQFQTCEIIFNLVDPARLKKYLNTTSGEETILGDAAYWVKNSYRRVKTRLGHNSGTE